MAEFFSCLKTLFTCLLYVSEICTINENEKGMNLTAKADGGRAPHRNKGDDIPMEGYGKFLYLTDRRTDTLRRAGRTYLYK